MTSNDLTIEILKGIREDLAGLRSEVVKTNERLDTLTARVDTTNERLDRVERRQVESEIRLATEIVAVAHAIDQLKDLLKAGLEVHKAVNDHERRILALEARPQH